jgi:hypothetical protein
LVRRFIRTVEAAAVTAIGKRATEHFQHMLSGLERMDDLHCLSHLATASANPQVRRRAAAFAEWLWFETALHYWPSRGWLTGANARTYNYVIGIGGAIGLVRPFFAGPRAERPR